MAAMDEERCKHGEIAAWCGESECYALRKEVPRRVWRTRYGEAYHRTRECEALKDGQRVAVRRGMTASTPEQVPLSVAMSAGLGACFYCFPDNVPPDAEPCEVLVDGKWLDGFLLGWAHTANGEWKRFVNYEWESRRRASLKGRTEFRAR